MRSVVDFSLFVLLVSVWAGIGLTANAYTVRMLGYPARLLDFMRSMIRGPWALVLVAAAIRRQQQRAQRWAPQP